MTYMFSNYLAIITDWIEGPDDPVIIETLADLGVTWDEVALLRMGEEDDPLTMKTMVFRREVLDGHIERQREILGMPAL